MINYIKKLFPFKLKYILWYIFKSPQRKDGFIKSILFELRGVIVFISHNYFSDYKNNLKPVSICTGIKDRTSNYLEFLLPSILNMNHQELIELSIFDCGSTDALILESEIKRKWEGRLVFTSEQMAFTRSSAFNMAIDQCTNQLFFVSDSDLSLPTNLVEMCNKYVTPKTTWFPICYSLFENMPVVINSKNGYWRPSGKGLFSATKKQLKKAGKYNALYTKWGLEDVELWLQFFKTGFIPLRSKCTGLIHHWHPSNNEIPEIPDHLKKYNL